MNSFDFFRALYVERVVEYPTSIGVDSIISIELERNIR